MPYPAKHPQHPNYPAQWSVTPRQRSFDYFPRRAYLKLVDIDLQGSESHKRAAMYEFGGAIGISNTFDSVYNNVVNARL